jgi:hypothetical protein
VTDEDVPFIEVFFPARGNRTGHVFLKHVPGKSLHNYFREPPLCDYHLLAIRERCKLTNNRREKLRLIHVPIPGEQIVLKRVKGALS